MTAVEQDEVDRLNGRVTRLEIELERIKDTVPESWKPILDALSRVIPDHRERDPIVAKFWRDVRGND